MRSHGATSRSRPVVFAALLAACGGSATMAGGGDAASGAAPDDAASGDAGGTGPDGRGPQGSDAAQGGDALEAAANGGDAAADGGASGVQCGPAGPAAFPTFDKQCSTDADCVLAVHTLSCCGDVLVMAISQGALPAFQAAESTCSGQYPACGCASNSVTFENGVAYGGTSDPTSAAAARCVNHSCLATYTGPTFACGNGVCATRVGYCEVQAPADGAPPAYRCVFLGLPSGDAGITCSNFAVSPGCTCADNQGNATVTCH